jgi:hypothetical protein
LGAKHSMELEKQTYGGKKKWLAKNHICRFVEMKEHFDGKINACVKPILVTVQE